MVFSLFKKEKDEEVQKNAAIALLETKDTEIIDHIFKHVQRRFCKRKLLLNLIELCGQVRAQVCFHHLKDIFLRKTLFNTKKKDSLRIAAANSLVRLQKEEAVKLVKDGLHDRSKHFREMCKIIIELDHNEKDHQMNCEVTDELVYEY
jgi:HEAT repeat protein